jgi:FKBP-type peptidyl-prolyl cis-trans isomerase
MIPKCLGAGAPAPSSRMNALPLGLALALLAAAISLPAGAQNTQGESPAGAPPAQVHQKKAPAAPAAQDESAQASYSIGVVMGMQLRQAGATPDKISQAQFTKGFRAALAGTAKPTPDDQKKIMAFIQEARKQQLAKNEDAARKFLADNAKQPGVQTTASGLQYKVLTAGSGTPPKPTDQVTVNYRGQLLDGTEFDSSYQRGQPATFPVNGVIRGWTEALQLMKPGSKYEIFLPPDLAYGANPPPGAPIPPGSALKFQVELLEIKPQAAPTASPHVGAPGAGARIPTPGGAAGAAGQGAGQGSGSSPR